VENVIAFTRPKFLDAGAFSSEPPRKKTFVQGWLAERQTHDNARYPSIAELRQVYAQGKTVILMTMQHRWLPIARLCRNLESFFHCPVHANMYLSPSGAQGFDAHFDPHEVFVLQLEGYKHWRVYGPGRNYPLIDERFNLPKDQLGPPRELRLEAGDLLYIPRGHVHEAFTSDCPSLHLTVGINVYRWADLLHEALAGLARTDERLRASVPAGLLGGQDLPPAVKERFRELLDLVAQTVQAEDAFHRLGDRFFGEMAPLPNPHHPSPEEVERIDLDTVLEKSPGVVCRVIPERNWVVIEYPGGQIGGPLKIASALHFVAGAERFPVRALPDDLGAEAKVVLARRLVRERLLRVADRGGK
jgi:hypothetical protein